MRLLSAGEGQIVPFLGPSLPDWADIIRHSPLEDSVGTQWETRGKNAGRGLGRKHFPQKKVLSLVLCVAMLLSVMVMGTGAASFTDQDEFSDNYAEAAEVLTGMGIIQGYDDGSFLPQRNINRAQVATMIYRAATGDVTDSKISQFVGEDLFDDVNADDWFAGYVNYCGNAEYIKGFTPDTFGPYKQVTGYQVLAMILRAVGYDENDEYTGDQWTLRVAATAREQGLLDNLNPDTNLAEPATRELVAQLIFEAIQIDTVRYSLAAGEYRPSTTPASSLGEQVFDLDVNNSADEWGRPEVLWTYNTGDEETVIEIDPVATYTTAVNDCDVYEDTGISGDVAAYVNSGRWNDTYNISKTATKDNIGAQGQLVEVYDYTTVDGKDATRIVVIDTFLAQVTNVTEAKYDSNNHLAKDASLTLTVYDGANTSVTLTNGSTNYTYAEGDMLLINAYTNDKDEVISGDGQHVEIVSAAESFVGAQTTIHYNADTHTINGTEYNDAYKFFRDDAGVTEDYNFTWYLDQYGNVIGATGITSNYAVLKDMIWVNGGRDGGYAEATLVYMDGTEATVTVDSIDEFDFSTPNWAENDVTPYLADSIESVFNGTGNFGGVSSDSSLNGNYDGFAMYRVDTNSDNSVNLEGIERYATGNFEIEYANDVTLDIDASAIVNLGDGVVAHVSNNTQILVNNADGTYTAYTGTANLPDYNWQSVEVFYDDEDGDNIADYVYIKTFRSVHGDYVFATSSAHQISSNDYGVTVEGVYVDGELTTVTTTPEIAHELIANQGKLYFATWTADDSDDANYGKLHDITLVNEARDNDIQILFGGIANYLEDTSNLQLVGNTLYVDGRLSYNVTNANEVIFQNNTYEMTLADVVKAIQEGADYGIWVVGNRYNNTTTVYVGTKLEETNTISVNRAADVAAEDVSIVGPTSMTNDWTVTINDKNDDGQLDLVVDMNAVSQYAYFTVEELVNGHKTLLDTYEQSDGAATLNDVAEGDVYVITVYTECDGTVCTAAQWRVVVEGWNIISNAITDVTNASGTTLVAGYDYDVYYDIEEAAKYAPTLSVDAAEALAVYFDRSDLNSTGVKLERFSETAAVDLDVFNKNADDASVDSTKNCVNVSVKDMTPEKTVCVISWESYGETVYFAFLVK